MMSPRMVAIAMPVVALALIWPHAPSMAQQDPDSPVVAPESKPAEPRPRPVRKPMAARKPAQTHKRVQSPAPSAAPPAAPAAPELSRVAQPAPPSAPQAEPSAQPALAPAAPAPGAKPLAPDFAAQLEKAGAGSCAAQVNAFAIASMAGVTQYNTASHWARSQADHRPVSLFIGQKFGNPGVPFGATGIFAAPNANGGCDGLALQVVPSPLPCAKVRETMLAHGKQIADLAGVALMQDSGGETLLVPTAANACVLVGARVDYRK